MNEEVLKKLEYDKVKEQLRLYAMSYLGRRQIDELVPESNVKVIDRLLNEAEEAKAIVHTGSSVPIPTLEGLETMVTMLGKGYMFSETDIEQFTRFLASVEQLRRFMAKWTVIAPTVSSFALSLHPLDHLREELERCVARGRVTDHASDELAKVRKKIVIAEDRVKKKLESVMQKYRNHLQEHIVMMRGERYVLAVKKESKRLVKGAILDESASGQTVFIEPEDISSAHQELTSWRVQEEREVAQVLSYLTGLIEEREHEIHVNLETVGTYDFLFAKAKYAKSIGGQRVQLNQTGEIEIRGGRHPLLGRDCVPLDIRIGNDYRALIITGPNTGGKTVSLKTVGLLALMVQSGLLIPVAEGSRFGVFTDVLADIGDGQSIEQSLSTFSSHIKNVIFILQHVGPRTLVLLDELATGTDPGEGVGLSIAVLEELYRRGATILATTHFNEIKQFAKVTPGFQNARMEFDVETLQPLYQLRVGEAGDSYAFWIALKLGISEDIIERSKQITYGNAKAVTRDRNAAGPTDTYRAAYQAGTVIDASNGRRERNASADKPGEAQNSQSAESDVTAENERMTAVRPYELGDRVWIHTLKRSGIVASLPDDKGNMVVLVKKERKVFNVKRVSLYVPRSELYPDNYDLDIVLESKEVRKKKKLMSRKHVQGLSIERPQQP